MEQALLKVTEQLQSLYQSIGKLQVLLPQQKGFSGTQKEVDGRLIDDENIQPEPTSVELKKELEVRASEMEKKLLEKNESLWRD